jgi:hypothetical protein
MFKRLQDIVEYFDNTDPTMPGGKAVDDPTGDSYVGTSWDAIYFNQILGFFLAAVIEGFGSMDQVSGTHDTAARSDVLNALKKIMQKITDTDVTPEVILYKLKMVHGVGSGLDADLFGGYPPSYYLSQGIGFFVKPVSGLETIIPCGELLIQYDNTKKYPVLISAAGNYPEFISFNAELLPDGLHIRPMRFIDGKLIPGTRMQKWGAGGQLVPGKKWGDDKWGADKWSASRRIGGDTWGDYEPMSINIVIKET